jgi:hypothetical protein
MSKTDIQTYYKKNVIKNNIKKNEDIEFQIIEWHALDESTVVNGDSDMSERSDGSFSSRNKEENKEYVMRCFGVTSDGISITCKITDFTPFYYIKVPDDFSRVKLARFLGYVEEAWTLKKYPNALMKSKCNLIKKKDLFGFRNNREYLFIRLVFNSITAMNKSKYIFKKPVSINGINSKPIKYKLKPVITTAATGLSA